MPRAAGRQSRGSSATVVGAAAAAAKSSPDDALATPKGGGITHPAPSLTLTRDRDKFDEAHACTFESQPPVFNYVDTDALPHVRATRAGLLRAVRT